MGNSLGPLLPNIYMTQDFLLKNKQDCIPTFYRRYVDETFCLFKTPEHIQQHLDFINSVDPAIQFDKEGKQNDTLSFVDTSISVDVITYENN